MEPRDYLTVYIAVLRDSETERWQPIGSLRDLINESVIPVRRGLIQFVSGYLRLADISDYERASIKKWVKAQDSIHNPGYDEPFVSGSGAQFHVISARITGDFIVTVA